MMTNSKLTTHRVLVGPGDPIPARVQKLARESVQQDVRGLQREGVLEAAGGKKPLVGPSDMVLLNRWMIQAHIFEKKLAGRVSLFGALFGAEASKVEAGVVHEAKRFAILEDEENGPVEYGVAVRLTAATTTATGKVHLTLPNLAAHAQLNSEKAMIGISVAGYAGPLGEMLPTPKRLDVESYVGYREAFEALQKRVFGEAGAKMISPVVLSYGGDLTDDEEPPD
ncbi:MAG: hypothetical protein AAFZ18_30595 [Myxococcota bacterium]